MFITRQFPKRRGGKGRTLFIPGAVIDGAGLDVDTVTMEVSDGAVTIRAARPQSVAFPCMAYGEMVTGWAELEEVAGRVARGEEDFGVEGGES